jgi:ferric iron reductase protein FhuF
VTGGAEAVRRAGAVGGFFAIDVAVETHEWQAFSTLTDPALSDVVLREDVDRFRSRLAAQAGVSISQVPSRVAASLWFQGWSARLLSPWLGAAALTGVIPVVGAEQVLWRPGGGQPVPLAVRDIEHAELADSDDLYAMCVEPLLEPLLTATAASYRVSRRVLWGNVASAAVGATAYLSSRVPAAAVDARRVLDVGLTSGRLVRQGEWRGPTFVRHSCCLMYRLPDAALCGDCVLADR